MHVCLDNLHCAVVEPCTEADFDLIVSGSLSLAAARRMDEFWLSPADFEAFGQSPPCGGFANDIRPLCLPPTGVAGVVAAIAPLPRPAHTVPAPLPPTPMELTEDRLRKMKVAELKVECRARGLPLKGLREDLITRLLPFVSSSPPSN